jgi:hypothetical protein
VAESPEGTKVADGDVIVAGTSEDILEDTALELIALAADSTPYCCAVWLEGELTTMAVGGATGPGTESAGPDGVIPEAGTNPEGADGTAFAIAEDLAASRMLAASYLP